MSTSISTESGMMFVFCRRASRSARTSCACTRARASRCCAAGSTARRGSGRGRAVAAGRSRRAASPATIDRQMSLICAVGWYVDSRRTTSAALTTALSRLPRHRPVRRRARDAQLPPRDALLADDHPDAPAAVDVAGRRAARLGEHVVARDRVPVVLDHPLRAVDAAVLLVGDAEEDQVALRLGSRSGRGGGS